ncbi:hypothetical protein AAW31_00570 [Nitrosomonas communis]|uniref:Uncharacterized protein n=1 Tax=Nitrosomonas communis TaxID=44574 RepID=A0A0F7KAS3_9PROT|nr:hypothetical protein AAW31_00570 [Nitrosomonas communis]
MRTNNYPPSFSRLSNITHDAAHHQPGSDAILCLTKSSLAFSACKNDWKLPQLKNFCDQIKTKSHPAFCT